MVTQKSYRKEMAERDQKIYEMNVVEKIPQRALAATYGISRGRVNQIIKQEAIKHKSKKDIPLKHRIIQEFENIDYQHLDASGRRNGANVSAAVNALFQYLRKSNPNATPEDIFCLFLGIDYFEMLGIQKMGPKKAIIIKEIQDNIKAQRNYYRYRLLSDCTKIY